MKKLLIIALALMLALSLAACKNNEQPDDPNNGVIDLNPNGTTNGNGTGEPNGNEGNGNGDVNNPGTEETFTELEQTIFIVASAATIRSDTYVSESTIVDYAQKGAEFKSTAYSANWYRIEYEVEVEETTEAEAAEGETQADTETQSEAKTEIKTCYIHKSVACVKDLTAVDLEEPLTLYIVTYALYVRSYYDFEVDDNRMFALEQGDEVTAVAKGNGWYKIQLSDDENGEPRFGYISSNEKYVSTTKPEETTTAGEETTTEAAETTTEATEQTTEAPEATTEAAE